MSRKTRELAAARAVERARAAKSASRRNVLVGIAGAIAAAGAGYGLLKALSAPPSAVAAAPGWTEGVLPSDVVYGDEAAPVTVYEFASLTCGFCARFHAESHQDFLDGWVETGKARLVFRHFPLDSAALAAAKAVSCLPHGERADAVSKLLGDTRGWAGHPQPAEAVLSRVSGPARQARDVRACFADGATEAQVMEALMTGRRAGVSATPSFIVNGRVYAGFMSADALGRIVAAA